MYIMYVIIRAGKHGVAHIRVGLVTYYKISPYIYVQNSYLVKADAYFNSWIVLSRKPCSTY